MVQRWSNLIYGTQIKEVIKNKALRRLRWKYFHSITYMRQKRVVFGPTRFKRRRYFRRKRKELWRVYYRFLKYWLEDFKKNKQSIRSSQLTSRFKYSYLITTSSVLKSHYLPHPGYGLDILSGSSLNQQHYRTLNKYHYLNIPLYVKYQSGTFLTHGTSPELYNQGALNEVKTIRMSYLYNDNQLVSFNTKVKKGDIDLIKKSYNELLKVFMRLIIHIIVSIYKIIQYTVLSFIL
jgi:hypothetical protein